MKELRLPTPILISREQRETFTWQDAFDRVAREWRPLLERLARVLARQHGSHDSALREELVQVALNRLWELDPTRYDERDHAYLRREMLARMRATAKLERRKYGGKRRVALEAAAVMKPEFGLDMGVDVWEPWV